MAIRPHRNAGPDGVTIITGTRTAGPGYAAFTDAELIPHTDGSSVPDPPGLLLLACQQPADEGGATLVADGARIIGTLASQYRDALAALYAPRAAFFGTAGGHLGPVCEPAGAQRTSLRFRLDDLAWFSSGATAAIPLLRAVIGQHVETFRLQRGEGLILSNTRWLHGRERYAGHRIMLRILGDPLPGTGIMPDSALHLRYPAYRHHEQHNDRRRPGRGSRPGRREPQDHTSRGRPQMVPPRAASRTRLSVKAEALSTRASGR